jgi:DNA mismatch endonuclease (patch repair protein)
MQSNKGRDTQPELALRSAAHALGLRYRVSVRPLRGLRRTADLVFTKVRVAVFLDGCFWHGCPLHATRPKTNAAFWRDKISANRTRDRLVTRTLRARGWTVLRIWGHELKRAHARRLLTRLHRAGLWSVQSINPH